MILTIIYVLFCYGFAWAFDDGKKWDFWDYVILFFSPVIVPISIGKTIGRLMFEILKLEEEEE